MIVNRIFFSILLFCAIGSLDLKAQELKEKLQFTEVKNLPVQRAVTAFAQDTNGFLWFSTYGAGLFKYDGSNFTSYKESWKDARSLSSSLVHAIYTDATGTIWLGTEKGLNRYRPETDDFENTSLLIAENEKPFAIHCVSSLNDSTLIVGSHNNGVYQVNKQSGKIDPIPFKIPINNDWLRFNSIEIVQSKIYLGTSLGLFEYNEQTRQIDRSEFILNGTKSRIPYHISKIRADANGNLWIGTYSNGLFRLDLNEKLYNYRELPITTKRILSITEIDYGKILVGTENDGLFILNQEGRPLDNYTHSKFGDNLIQSNSIWSLFVDKDDRIWMGYYSDGISFYDPDFDKFKDLESIPYKTESLQDGSVTGILEDDNSRLWIGMDGGGIDVYDKKNGSFTHLIDPDNPIATGLTTSDIQALFLDSKDNLWAGSWNAGIFFLKKGTKQFTNYTGQNGLASRSTICFAEDSQGTIYIGTFNAGLITFDPKTNQFERLDGEAFSSAGMANCDVRKVVIDQNDMLWVGTTKGLFTVKKKADGYEVQSQNARMYADRDSEDLQYYILSLFLDDDRNLWIGTDGGGLCKYDKKTGSYVWFQDVIEKQTIASIISDSQNRLWLAGNNGLSNFDPKSEEVINYTVNDGLLANDFHNNSVLKDDQGRLYFGNYKGINYFDPAAINSSMQQPDLYFAELRLFNEKVGPKTENSPLHEVLFSTRKLTLKPHQSVFTIEYAAIDFTRPSDNSYAYILEGFDNSWNYVGNAKSATYTNIPPGNYTFKVKAANNDGVWTEEPIALSISLLHPWYKQTWAILLYILLSLILAYIAYQFTQSRIAEKRLIQYERDKRRQEEELNNRKLQFFTNISHEFRTPLTLIKNPIEDIITNKEYTFPKAIAEKHRSIFRNTERLIRLINELMDFRKLQFNKTTLKVEKIAITPFCEQIVAHFKEEAFQRNIALEIASEEEDLHVYADPGMLEKIIFNLLSNAFKATPDHGLVSVGLRRTDSPIILPEISSETPVEALEIQVEDTGFGIPKEEIEKVFDPFYQVEGMNKQYYGGTGIGLEVVRSFLIMNKGKIEVSSKVHKGTSFRIYLGLGKAHFSAQELISVTDLVPEAEITETPVPEEITTSQKSLPEIKKGDKLNTLLIIEDNFELRKYLKEQLKTSYKIIEAINGEEGLNLAQKFIPDVILTDVLMPQMDGVTFCRKLKNDIKTSHIPVLMLTAKAQTDDWLAGLDAGADAYINKPFNIKIVRSQLKQLIANRQKLFTKYFQELSTADLKLNSSSLDKKFIAKVINYIYQNISDPKLNVENLADELSLSRSQLYRKIKALTGQTANEFIRKIRLEKAKELLENGVESVSEVGYKVGFATPSYFTRCFKAEFGKLPTDIK
ncbi:two-component regulator propeller domain-containing protein [Leeuwenhoekiella sp. H156]|uniref:two-component regulator propeller domain-containing protein n=1 Tax=Leeuwenhoekiella sp. H156 TaxID=3450128 RepID=UPI003FA4D0E5